MRRKHEIDPIRVKRTKFSRVRNIGGFSRLAAVTALSSLTLAGCGFPPADFVVQIDRPGMSFTVRIYDPSSLITGATDLPFTMPPHNPPLEDGATAHPEANSIDVVWTGGECKRTPLIHVDGSAQAMSIRLEPDASDQLPLPEICNAAGVFLGVTLQTSVPVQQSAISYSAK